MYNTVCFIKIVRPQDKKRRKNQLSLLNKNDIAWYVWTPTPIASQKRFGCSVSHAKIGHMKNAFLFLTFMYVITVMPMKNPREINTSV